ncbi:MAG: hypothetical protein RL757_2783 [Bacteroidota bacterium]|jgi:hypothetical protein
MIKNILKSNKILFWLGASHFIVFLLLLVFFPFNSVVVLGINSMLKPIKFALSIWLYSWTMALILSYFEDKKKVKMYAYAAVVTMSFEQIAITSQAFRGELSHFNTANTYGIVLFSLMGVFITTITLWTAYMAYIFTKQKSYNAPPALVLGIKIGLVYFVVFSLFGGYISSLKGHTVGATDGNAGLPFLNWSLDFGDLRVAHFFGIHALQAIPLFALVLSKNATTNFSIKMTYLFSILYLFFILFTLFQGFSGNPFLHF